MGPKGQKACGKRPEDSICFVSPTSLRKTVPFLQESLLLFCQQWSKLTETNSLLLPTIQLVFSNVYLGIGLGALNAAKQWTTTKTRPRSFGGDNKDSALDEHYMLARYGNWFAHLRATETLADRVGAEISSV